ncbi:MAG: TonB-dependent receptor [Bacteroidetes bacterium]|nr:TonB-dependent receptor [Bacteroidota bacterium]
MKTQSTILGLLFFLIFFNTSFAQVQISGKVTYRGKPIKDVSVTLVDTYDGATTNIDGFYSFKTTEQGKKVLKFTNDKFIEDSVTINLENKDLIQNISLKERINEIDAVTITVGSIEASDKKRASALLSPIDIYTTAGTNGQISSALNFLPGTQKVGESEGLFIRGGSGAESKIFMDGSLVNNYFSNSIPGIAGRDRFNTSLFKGNIFSSGGYSALYGQALSGILILESVDLPETSSFDVAASPLFLSGSFQRLSKKKNYSFGASLGYSNLALMQKLLQFNTQFTTPPQGWNGDANFRWKTKSGGILKYYTNWDQNKMAIETPSLEPNADQTQTQLSAFNNYHNLSFKQKLGQYHLNASTSYAYNQSDLVFNSFNEGQNIAHILLKNEGNYWNAKVVLEKKLNAVSAIRGGFELNNTHETNNFGKNYKDIISSLFTEMDWAFSNRLSTKIGLRAENSSFLEKLNLAPRLALAYKLSKDWTSNIAYGVFYQNPESKYINAPASLGFQKAEHYILQIQRNSEGRTFRMEAFIKEYQNLEKTFGNAMASTIHSTTGDGMAKGFELFWRDKKSIKNIDYWVSYSYLDGKRDFLNYPTSLVPSFAAKHTLSVVAKKFITEWKTGFNLSYTYNSGRPYYDIGYENGQNVLRNSGSVKDYNSLNFSVNYLPNLGKSDSKYFTVLVLSINNVLGNKNIYGYQFSNDGSRNSAMVPPIGTFVFVGAFISFGVDKTNDAINNNL